MLKFVCADEDVGGCTPLKVVYGNDGDGTNSYVESRSSSWLSGRTDG